MVSEAHQTSIGDSRLTARIHAAAEVATAHAAAVDTEARFPSEAFAEIRRQRLLAVMLPPLLGGEAATLSALIDACYVLGQACSSTALIYAMHQIKMACVVRHARGSPGIERILRRIASEQLLLASSTTEGQAGGNVRSSEAAIQPADDHISLVREATVISYALEADGIVTTARRAGDAGNSDQVLVLLLKSDYTLNKLQGWDTLGMRGTCSNGFTLRARAPAEQVLPDPYERIHAQTMVPFAHLLWGAVWAGIAAAAVATAQAFCRHVLGGSKGELPPGAAQVTQALSQLTALRALLATTLQRFEAIQADEKAVASLEFQSTITLLKVQASELAAASVMSAMRACGLSGYRNDDPFSVGRHLRDILSAPLMINNERILANLTTASLLNPLPTSIRG
jgi:acyl-CoA dehydrogenase